MNSFFPPPAVIGLNSWFMTRSEEWVCNIPKFLVATNISTLSAFVSNSNPKAFPPMSANQAFNLTAFALFTKLEGARCPRLLIWKCQFIFGPPSIDTDYFEPLFEVAPGCWKPVIGTRRAGRKEDEPDYCRWRTMHVPDQQYFKQGQITYTMVKTLAYGFTKKVTLTNWKLQLNL